MADTATDTNVRTHYICVGNHYAWGRAETVEQSIKNMIGHGGGQSTEYKVFHVAANSYVEDIRGSVMYSDGCPPVLVRHCTRKSSSGRWKTMPVTR